MDIQPNEGKLKILLEYHFFPVLFLEQNEPQNTDEYTNLETSQYSQNIVPKIVEFSSSKDSLFLLNVVF
jgi:hypothetical protein